MKKWWIALVIFMSVLLLCASVQADAIRKPPEKTEPVPLVINTAEPTTEGTLTLYNGDSEEVLYQYLGDIEITNDGANGDNIEIVIHVPNTGCSCFDENGKLLE